jgi:GNAT superfamily N-acetyltransferase
VLRDATGALGEGLDDLVAGLARGEVTPDQLRDRLDALRLHAAPGSAEEYFLVRLSWPHVRPGDAAGFVSHERGGVRQSEVVITREDSRGRPFLIRRPLSPREVGDLHRLFISARLPVSFRADHQFLVALDLSGRLLGGVFYELDRAAREAYLEKIVVAEAHRREGVSQALMQEFMHRLQAEGVRLVTTGFFRPDYFVHFGFRVDRAYGGQVRLLDESPARA